MRRKEGHLQPQLRSRREEIEAVNAAVRDPRYGERVDPLVSIGMLDASSAAATLSGATSSRAKQSHER